MATSVSPSTASSVEAAALRIANDVQQQRDSVRCTPPPTVEILWQGKASLGFTLKRKRTGAILVHTVKSANSRVRVGSELKLVGGFPVQRLTVTEVKKVMLLAPKPVSLVFLNHDDGFDNSSFVTDCSDRGSFENEFLDQPADVMYPIPMESAEHSQSLRQADHTVSDMSSSENSPSSSSQGKLKRRKTSKLKNVLDKMNQLLHRPVRQSALNIAPGKSIVV